MQNKDGKAKAKAEIKSKMQNKTPNQKIITKPQTKTAN